MKVEGGKSENVQHWAKQLLTKVSSRDPVVAILLCWKCIMTIMSGFLGFQWFLRMSGGTQPSQHHILFDDQQLHSPEKGSLNQF